MLLSGAGLGLIGGLMIASGASAQSVSASKVEPDPATQLPELVVTAQFRGENLQKTPLAITAINGKMLDARGQVNVTDIAANAPSVTIETGSASFGPTPVISIRGIGAHDFTFASEPGVGVYIDDVYQSTLVGSAIDLLDLDRVEISRGPQGTLSGKNAIGGTIKLYSKPANGHSGDYLDVGYGSDNQAEIKAGGDVTLVPDRLFLAGAVGYHREDGYLTRYDYGCLHPGSGIAAITTAPGCKLGEEGGFSHTAGRLSLRWLPTNDLEVVLTGDGQINRDEPVASKLIAARNLTGTPATNMPLFITSNKFANFATYYTPEENWALPAVNNVDNGGLSANIKYDISPNISLTSITAERVSSIRFTSDGGAGPLTAANEDNRISSHTFTQELRLNSTFGKLDMTAGGYYLNFNGTLAGRFDLGYPAPLPGPPPPGGGPPPGTIGYTADDKVNGDTEGGFIHGVYHVTDKLNLVAGYRYTSDSKSYLFNRTATTPNGALPAGVSGTVGQYSGAVSDYRASVDYQWTPALMTYATFSTGFRGGGINPRPFTPAQVVPFGPEYLKNYELGLKSELFDHRLRLDVGAFYDTYSAIQIVITDGFAGFPESAVPINAGDATIQGLEAEFEIHPVQNLEIDGSASYLKFNYTRLSADAIASDVSKGDVTPYTPTTKASLGAQYKFPLGEFGSLTPRLDVNYQGAQYTSAQNASTNKMQGYTVLNGHLIFRPLDNQWNVSLEVENITNLYYYTNIDDGLRGIGTVLATPARPRTFFVRVSRHF
jgi:iron complex outermembrane receptor protein